MGRSQLLGNVIRGCRGAQEPKKIKIAKNGLKHPQNIIECHFGVFGVRTIGVGHHMTVSVKKRAKSEKIHFRDTAKTKNMIFFRKKSILLKTILCVLIRIFKQER